MSSHENNKGLSKSQLHNQISALQLENQTLHQKMELQEQNASLKQTELFKKLSTWLEERGLCVPNEELLEEPYSARSTGSQSQPRLPMRQGIVQNLDKLKIARCSDQTDPGAPLESTIARPEEAAANKGRDTVSDCWENETELAGSPGRRMRMGSQSPYHQDRCTPVTSTPVKKDCVTASILPNTIHDNELVHGNRTLSIEDVKRDLETSSRGTNLEEKQQVSPGNQTPMFNTSKHSGYHFCKSPDRKIHRSDGGSLCIHLNHDTVVASSPDISHIQGGKAARSTNDIYNGHPLSSTPIKSQNTPSHFKKKVVFQDDVDSFPAVQMALSNRHPRHTDDPLRIPTPDRSFAVEPGLEVKRRRGSSNEREETSGKNDGNRRPGSTSQVHREDSTGHTAYYDGRVSEHVSSPRGPLCDPNRDIDLHQDIDYGTPKYNQGYSPMNIDSLRDRGPQEGSCTRPVNNHGNVEVKSIVTSLEDTLRNIFKQNLADEIRLTEIRRNAMKRFFAWKNVVEGVLAKLGEKEREKLSADVRLLGQSIPACLREDWSSGFDDLSTGALDVSDMSLDQPNQPREESALRLEDLEDTQFRPSNPVASYLRHNDPQPTSYLAHDTLKESRRSSKRKRPPEPPSASPPFSSEKSPDTIIFGEVAFQLERIILSRIFHGGSKQLTGYNLSNVERMVQSHYDYQDRPMITKQLQEVKAQLALYGWDHDYHPKLVSHLIKTYGTFPTNARAGAAARKRGWTDPRILKEAVLWKIPKEYIRDMIVLLDCLIFLSNRHNIPLFAW